jgi:hypothetical protein
MALPDPREAAVESARRAMSGFVRDYEVAVRPSETFIDLP